MSNENDSSTPISKSSHKRNFWYIIGSVVLVLILAGGYWYYQSAQQKSTSAAATQSALKTARVTQGSIVISASGTGTVVAAATANLAFSNSGSTSSANATLTKINVTVGDQVKAGEVLAVEDNTTQAQALAQAKLNLAQLTSPSAIATAQGAVATDQAAAGMTLPRRLPARCPGLPGPAIHQRPAGCRGNQTRSAHSGPGWPRSQRKQPDLDAD